MKKILLPLDYADHSPKAINYALAIAKIFEAQILAVHIYDVPEEPLLSKREEEELGTAMLHQLKEYVEEYREVQYNTVPIDYLVDVGLPEDEIIELSLDERVELIIIGMTGAGQGGENLFGRTSLSVLSKADCPVLVLPASLDYEIPKNITYLTDFHFRDIGSLNVIRKWAEVLQAKVHCLHVADIAEMGIDADVNMSMLADCYHTNEFGRFEVLKGALLETTNEYSQINDISLLVTLSQKRGWVQRVLQGSHTRKMAKRLAVPILVFKENAYQPVLYPLDFSGISIG